MARDRRLFRESALERLSSPDQLDRLLQITSPRGWVALVAVWALLGTIVVWSVLGTVATKEQGSGIIVPVSGLRVIEAQSAGRVSAIEVGIGSTVSEDTVVARIDRRDLEDQMVEKQARLGELRRQHELLVRLDADEATQERDLAAKEREKLQRRIDHARQRAARLTERAVIVDDLITLGAMTPIDRHEVDDDREQAELDASQAQLEMDEIDLRTMNASFKRTRAAEQRTLQIAELEEQIKTLQSRIVRDTRIACEFGGEWRVIEVRVALHSVVDVGDPVMVIERTGESRDLKAVLFVSAAGSRNIEIDDAAEIAPSNVKREEFGAIRGWVISVTQVPISREAMMTELNDQDLVDQFMETIGPPRMVEVAFHTDPTTESGYAWTSRAGPPTRVSSGSLCTGLVSVEKRRPIELVIPNLRRIAGAD